MANSGLSFKELDALYALGRLNFYLMMKFFMHAKYYQKKKVILFKPWIDERYSKDNVVTHKGQQCPSSLVKRGKEIVERSESYDVIAVDEVFMIPDSAKALIEIFTSGKDVLVSSLQLSSKPDPLPEIKDILPYATHIEICPAVCSMCDADAFYTRRKIDTDGVVQVGGAEMYEPLCFYHYKKTNMISFCTKKTTYLFQKTQLFIGLIIKISV